jgi:hypothetical protein
MSRSGDGLQQLNQWASIKAKRSAASNPSNRPLEFSTRLQRATTNWPANNLPANATLSTPAPQRQPSATSIRGNCQLVSSENSNQDGSAYGQPIGMYPKPRRLGRDTRGTTRFGTGSVDKATSSQLNVTRRTRTSLGRQRHSTYPGEFDKVSERDARCDRRTDARSGEHCLRSTQRCS